MAYSLTVDLTGDAAGDLVSLVRSVVRRANAVLHEPEFRGNEWAYVKDCIDTGWVSSVGAYVDRFEAMLAELTGASCAVATANGTAALHVALLLAGVRPGDEVLMPTLTFIATANAASYANAVPHFVESCAETLAIDVPALRRHLEHIARVVAGECVNTVTGRPIRAIVPMHCFGHVADMYPLLELAGEFRLTVVEDAAEALGSSRGGVAAGRFGLLGTLSFNGNKTVTTGGGGAIITDDVDIGHRAKHLTTTARVRHRWAFSHDEVGFNYRLPNINAALGCAQLERLDDMLARKRRLADAYIAAFANSPVGQILAEPPGSISNYWLVALMLDAREASRRDELLDALNQGGLMARPVWTLMHHLPMYAGCPRSDVTVAEDIEARLINLPSSPQLMDGH